MRPSCPVTTDGQSRLALGLELLASGLVIGITERVLDHRTPRADEETTRTWILGRLLPSTVTCGCLVLAGATLLGQAGGGLCWMVPSVVAAFAFGLFNVWVLVIEILR
jgi:hypothetical protein